MLRTISPLEPIFFSSSPIPERKNGKTMAICKVHRQPYHHNGQTIRIVCPDIESDLCKTDKHTGITENYAVVNIFRKSRGINRGIIDRVQLQPIYDMDANQMSVGETDIPYILKLTNHGNWWDKWSTRQYNFAWLEMNTTIFRPIEKIS